MNQIEFTLLGKALVETRLLYGDFVSMVAFLLYFDLELDQKVVDFVKYYILTWDDATKKPDWFRALINGTGDLSDVVEVARAEMMVCYEFIFLKHYLEEKNERRKCDN